MTRPTPISVHMADITAVRRRHSVWLSIEMVCLALAVAWVAGVVVGMMIARMM